MEILTSVATKIASYTVAPIGRHVGYLIFYKDNLKELADQVEELESASEQIAHIVDAERRNGRVIVDSVQYWMGRVDEITEAAKRLLEDTRRADVGCSKLSFPDLRSRHQLGREAKKMAREVADVQGMGKEFDQLGYRPPLEGVGFISATRGIELESRKSMKNDIVLALIDPEVSIIGVSGLPGVGKTFMVKEVAKQVRDDKFFDEVVIAHVSQNPDIARIQGEIADQLGLRLEEKSLVGRARRLFFRIQKEETILIILDDLWERLDLEELGIPLAEDHHKGCKLLLTSRNQDTLQKMETQRNFRLQVLNDEETWSLFEVMSMTGDAIKDPNLKNIATQVAEKCEGLPLLIVTLGRALRNKDAYYWKEILNQLERVDHNDEIRQTTYSALELSYNCLESDEMKAIFLLSAVLGTSCTVNDLLKYGIGLGVFTYIYTVRDAQNRLNEIVSGLKQSCLLLEHDASDQVRMHEIVRDVAVSIACRDHHVFAEEMNTKLKEWPTKDSLTKFTQIIINRCHKKLPKRLGCPMLKLLCLNGADNSSLEMPNSFFEGMGSLQVLGLTCMNMSALPTSLGSLVELKTLCLDHCVLGDMTVIGTLENLEILSLKKSPMTELPREMGQLINLRMLDLSSSSIRVIPPNVISNMTKLEELYMGETSIKWGVEYSSNQENASLDELRHLPCLTALDIQILGSTLPIDSVFGKLKTYNILVGDVWGWSDINCGTSRTLKLKLDTGFQLEHGIKALFKSVEHLYLDEKNGNISDVYQLTEEGFPQLKLLHIQNSTKIQYISNSMEMAEVHDFFPNLEILELHNLNNLEEICHGPLSDHSFSKLKVIKVKKCDQLQNLISPSMAERLTQLLEIEVSECISMKEIVAVGSGDRIEFQRLHSYELTSSETQQMPIFNAKVAFPSLEKLKLCSMNLKIIFQEDKLSPVTFIDNLTSLIVEDCGDLAYLFSSSMSGRLSKLKRLEINNCHMVEEATEGSQGTDNIEVEFPNSMILKLSSMNLEKIWSKNSHHFKAFLRNLTSLVVEDCGDLTYLFSFSMVKNLSNLEKLEISKCHNIEEILKATEEGRKEIEVLFYNLKILKLSSLNSLKRIWDEERLLLETPFKNLTSLIVEDCGSLTYLFSSSMIRSLSNLEILEISKCHKMEEVLRATEEERNETEVVFHNLKIMKLSSLVNLKKIWNIDGKLLKAPFRNLTTLIVEDCGDLTYLFPTSMVGSLPNLEILEISKCHKMEVILKAEEGRNENEVVFHNLKIMKLSSLTNLKKIWDKVGQLLEAPFRSLTKLIVKDCNDLTYLFSSSMVKSLSNLEILKISKCNKMELIFKAIEGARNETEVVFHNLKILKLRSLTSLKKLWDNQVLKAPLRNLSSLIVEDCGDLTYLFSFSMAGSLSNLEILEISECHKMEEILKVTEEERNENKAVFHNLRILKLSSLISLKKLWDQEVQLLKASLKNLTRLIVEDCDDIMYLFSSSTVGSLSNLEILEISHCHTMEEIVNSTKEERSKIEDVFPNLKILNLSSLISLKKIWDKADQFLNPPFRNLTSLIVENCSDITYLFSISMVGSLSNLEYLEISKCHKMEEILKTTEQRRNETEVVFPKLKILKLSSLISLKKILDKEVQLLDAPLSNLTGLIVEDCGDLTYLFLSSMVGSLSKLEVLEISKCHKMEEIFKATEESRNDIEILFHNLKIFKLSSLTSLKKIWDEEVLLLKAPLSHLTSLIVEDCGHLTYMFSSSVVGNFPNLEILEISECHKMVEILKATEEGRNETEVMFPSLKTLKLSSIISVKKIWGKEGPLTKAPLTSLIVKNCGDLTYLFSSFMVRTLSKLKILEISECHEMEEILKATEEGGNEIEALFPRLQTVIVSDMKNLKTLWQLHQRPSPESLRKLRRMVVKNCEKLVNIVSIKKSLRRSDTSMAARVGA